MDVRELKALLKSLHGDIKIKVMIPDRNNVFESKDVKITVTRDNVIIEGE